MLITWGGLQRHPIGEFIPSPITSPALCPLSCFHRDITTITATQNTGRHLNLCFSSRCWVLSQTQKNRSRNICLFLLKVQIICRGYSRSQCRVANTQSCVRECFKVYYLMIIRCPPRLRTGALHHWEGMSSRFPRSTDILLLLQEPPVLKFWCWDSRKCCLDSVTVSKMMLLRVSCLPPSPALRSLRSQHKDSPALLPGGSEYRINKRQKRFLPFLKQRSKWLRGGRQSPRWHPYRCPSVLIRDAQTELQSLPTPWLFGRWL